MNKKVLIIDFGSQYSQLIVHEIRNLEIYSEMHSWSKKDLAEMAKQYDAIVLSGGPNSVEDEQYGDLIKSLLSLKKPILGICYGMQIIHKVTGGTINYRGFPEFGDTKIYKLKDHPLLDGIEDDFIVTMSHNDSVIKLGNDFVGIAKSNFSYSIAANDKRKIYTIQFHPETESNVVGKRIMQNFLFLICRFNPWWKAKDIMQEKIEEIRKAVGQKKILLALSGGLDSSVTAKLLKKASPGNVIALFVDTGFIRSFSKNKIIAHFKEEFGDNFHVVDAKERFLEDLKGIVNPEEKRQKIGKRFLIEFKKFLDKYPEIEYLAQGTIHSDLIESGKKSESSETIKTHHNTINDLRQSFKVIEPLADLLKNEVKEWGEKLNLPPFILKEHPFPGPGFAIRIIGEVTQEKVEILRKADSILVEKLKDLSIYDKESQAFAILLNFKTVGVKGDQRHYGYTVALRCISSSNFMTAKISNISISDLTKIGEEIINNVPEVTRVVYDITSKPPGTIEWE